MKRVFAHIGFSTALTLIILNLVSVEWALVILSVASVLFLASLVIDKTRKAVSVPLCISCVIFACLLFVSNYYGNFVKQTSLNNQSADAEFYIVDIEKEYNTGYLYTVKTKSISADNAPQDIKLYLDSNTKINADYYEIIKGNVKFEAIADNGFDSHGSFADNVFLTAKLNSYEATGKRVKSLNKGILACRLDVKETFKRQLPKDEGALALALVTGDKSALRSEIIEDFRQCGASHLMAVSGLHLSVVSISLYWILKKIRVPKIPRIALSIIAILFYAALAGFSKSVIRAGIMMSVLYIGRAFKQKSDSLNSLGIAVFIICLNPYAVTDAGVLLTVTAALGVITISNEIKKLIITKNKALDFFFSALSVSFSVFVTTFPVMYFLFGTVSVVGIFLNIVLIPIAEAALVSSAALALFRGALYISLVLREISKAATALILAIVKYCASLSYSLLRINSVEIGLAICGVFVIFGIAFMIKKKNTFKIAAVLSAFIMIVTPLASSFVNKDNMFVREVGGYKGTAYILYDEEYAVVVGVEDGVQYNLIKGIIESSQLDVLMVIDTEKSDYSKKLTEIARVDNYIIKPDDSGVDEINCNNIIKICDFDIDLLPYLNIKYSYNQKTKDCLVSARIYNSSFMLGSQTKNDYDIVYTVGSGGYKHWRINKWLK